MSAHMVIVGMGWAYSVATSSEPLSTKPATSSWAYVRTSGSRSVMRLGVRTRDKIPRSSSWRGGSMLNMLGGIRVMSVSINVPRADENVCQSVSASLTSSARVSIQ